MKRLLVLLLAVMMLLSLAACAPKNGAAPEKKEESKVEKKADETKAEESKAEEKTEEKTEKKAEEPKKENADETKAEAKDEKEAKSYKLGFILGSREHVFYNKIEEGIKAAAKELGVEAVVLESNLDGAIASQRIEDLVVDKCDAISLSVNDPSGSTPAIVAADKDGVPMFAFDCTSSETDVIKCFVGTDNFEGGVAGANYMVKYLEDNGKLEGATVGIIGYPEPQSCIDREKGWFSVIDKIKDEKKLKVVNIGNYKGDASTAESLMNDALTQNPDMTAIFTVGDPACVGALAAIKASGASTVMVGFDANPEAHEAILDKDNGKIWIADVAQDPVTIGKKICEEMVNYLKNGKVDEQTILIKPFIVDKENATVSK